MGKRRNKKQGNRQNTGNKTIEQKGSAEGKAIEELPVEEKEQRFSDGMTPEAEEQSDASYAEEVESYIEEPDGSMEALYAEETEDPAEVPYVEESDYHMAASYAEETHEQSANAYVGKEDTEGDQEFKDVPIDSLLEDVNASETEKKDSLGRQRLEATNDFSDFTKDFFRQIGKWIKLNRRMAVTSLAVCVGVVIVIWIVVSISRSIDEARLAASVPDSLQIDLTLDNGVIPVPQEALQINAYPAVNELVAAYFQAMQDNDIETLRTLKNYVDDVETAKVNAKYQYVEGYDNITCYTKIGPIANSYIVYVCYDVKLRNWEIIAPSLQTLFVCTNDEGNLYIYVGDFDDNVANYIAAISSQEDVYDLWQKVQTEYKEIMDANPDFAAYMSTLNGIIKDEVGEQLADAGYLDNETEDPAEGEPEEGTDVSENAAEPEEEGTKDFQVQAVTTVNVRASDSEVADRLGKVEAGTVLLCQEHQVNGWSRVLYEDQVGYIKTEYLQTVGDVDESTANGTVTVSETVNVRRSANIEGEQMGVAYAGESFPLIGSTDAEWTQIIYNGQTGYIKSEFILEQ